MEKYFKTGWAFLTVSLLCIGVACISNHTVPLIVIGVFWLIMAILVRGHYVRKKKKDERTKK